jgi:hypothetical protein
MDPKKVEAVLEWEEPRSVKEVQSFLGFANFYRRFIRKYSKVVTPLTDLLKKENQKKFPLEGKEKRAFENLKLAFTSVPIL